MCVFTVMATMLFSTMTLEGQTLWIFNCFAFTVKPKFELLIRCYEQSLDSFLKKEKTERQGFNESL